MTVDSDLKKMKEVSQRNFPPIVEKYGLPRRHDFYHIDCWICGQKLYNGPQKCHGIQELQDGTMMEICSICFQVQATINKDSLSKKDAPNSCGQSVKRLFLTNLDYTKVTVWEVLPIEPWLKQIERVRP